MADPAYDVETNVVSSVRWLSSLGKTKVRKLIFISSGGTVYGLPRTNLIDEQHPTDPINSYGVTKLMIEKYVAIYAALNRVEHLILRPSNVYGEGQRLHIGQGVIGVLVDRALRREALEVWGSGKDLRDYLYIDDFVGAVMSLLDYSGPHRVFNVSSGHGHSVLEILEILQRQLEDMPAVIHTEARGFDVPVNVLDSTLLRQATGWQARTALEDGVRRVVRWLKDEAAMGRAQ
jgi:UDP-glucose 4-epimerase